MITVNLVPPVRLQTQKKVKVNCSGTVVASGVLNYRGDSSSRREIFYSARHFFGNLSLLDLALSLHIPASANKVVTEATMSKHTHVRRCQIKNPTFFNLTDSHVNLCFCIKTSVKFFL